MLWQMKVTDEAKYAAAYKKMMEAQAEDGLASGSYGVNRIMAGGVDGMTHFAYIFGSSMAEMTEALSVSQASDNFKRFAREVESIREIITVDAGYTLIQYLSWKKKEGTSLPFFFFRQLPNYPSSK